MKDGARLKKFKMLKKKVIVSKEISLWFRQVLNVHCTTTIIHRQTGVCTASLFTIYLKSYFVANFQKKKKKSKYFVIV